MSTETQEEAKNLISYYGQHSIEQFVKGDNERKQNFVVDDFTKLLKLLKEDLEKENII